MADFNMTPSGQPSVTLALSRNLAFTADSNPTFPGNIIRDWPSPGNTGLPLTIGSRPYRLPTDGRSIPWRFPEPA